MRSLDDYLCSCEVHARPLTRCGRRALRPPLPWSSRRMLSRARRSALFLGLLGLRRFSPGVGDVIAQAAMLHGVELLGSEVDAIVGTGRVEAVISSDKVYPCDGVVVLPRSVPALPETGCSMGSHGGSLVDRWMRTSSRGVFAAGDCAELRLGSTRSRSGCTRPPGDGRDRRPQRRRRGSVQANALRFGGHGTVRGRGLHGRD